MGDSEKTSEKPRKRGRPRAFGAPMFEGSKITEEQFWQGQGLLNSSDSRRTHLNKMYGSRALAVLLRDQERFEPLMRFKDVEAGKAKFPWTVLHELGRIEDEDRLAEVAEELQKHKLSAREAVTRLRRLRLGGSKPGDALALCDELVDALNDYLERHPDISNEDIRAAIRTLYGQIKD